MGTRYSVNDTVTLTDTFKVSGTPTDPTTVSLTVTDPSGTATTYTYAAAEITKSGTGVYTKNITASSAGTWRYTWTGTGTAADVQDGSFTVFRTADLNAYCTVEQLRDEMGITSTDTTDDTMLQIAINAASRQIDNWCGWRFYQDSAVATREFYPDDSYSLFIDEGISTATGLIVKIDADGDGVYETTLTSGTDFVLAPSNAADMTPAYPFTQIRAVGDYWWPSFANGRAGVQVTAKFGWPTVPDDVVKATLIQAAQLFKAKDAAFGVAGFGEFGAVRVRSSLNPLAAGLLAAYRKPAIG